MGEQFIKNAVRALIPEPLLHLLRVYRYRVEITNACSPTEKYRQLLQSFRRHFINRKKIMFYPDEPLRNFCVIYKVLMFLGYKVVRAPQTNFDLAVKYWLGFDGNPFCPEKSFPGCKSGQTGGRVLNIRCNDISKVRVNSVFEETFGYPLSVDPRKHRGECVMKLNWNALHKGRIIECPTEPGDGDFVYQKLIQNETRDGFVRDIRVPIVGNKTPFVYLKYRSVKDRFIDRAHTNTRATIAEVGEVLSENELKNIHEFCTKIGMDYGEVDVLRDDADGLIYIVDANIAPSGPMSAISDEDAKVAVMRLANAFEEVFGG